MLDPKSQRHKITERADDDEREDDDGDDVDDHQPQSPLQKQQQQQQQQQQQLPQRPRMTTVKVQPAQKTTITKQAKTAAKKQQSDARNDETYLSKDAVKEIARLHQEIQDGKVIAQQPRHVRMRWYRRVLFAQTLLLAFTVLLAHLASQRSATIKPVIDQNPWAVVLLAIGLGVTALIYGFARIHAWARGTQYIVGIFIVLTCTAALCAISAMFDTHLFTQGAALSTLIVFALMLYTLQPWLDVSLFWACGFIIILALGALTVFVWLPNRDWFEHPGTQWLNPPQNVLELTALSILSAGFALWFVRSLHHVEHIHRPRDYVAACILVYIDMMWTFSVILRTALIRCDCASRLNGSGANGGSAADDVASAARSAAEHVTGGLV